MASLLRPKKGWRSTAMTALLNPRGEEEKVDGGAALAQGWGGALRWRCFGPRDGEEHGDGGTAPAWELASQV